jgi:hypothetical protein
VVAILEALRGQQAAREGSLTPGSVLGPGYGDRETPNV